MPDLNRLLADHLALAFGLMAALVALLLVATLVQAARLRKAVRRYRDLVRDEGGGSLHELLAAHADQIVRAGERMTEIEALHGLIARRTERSLQHIGMVRFNPFDDTGSDQSFAIALLDEKRDGVVISSLHGRANTRVFAKPINRGVSGHQLSGEETEAIRLALADGESP